MDSINKLTIPGSNDPENLSSGSIYFIGTATTLIRYGGLTILTDPNFLHAGDHVHLGYGLTSKRLTNPAMNIEDLPELDLCILSHLHGDHWDRIANEKMPRAVPIVTTEHAATYLRGQGFHSVRALDVWNSFEIAKGNIHLRITAMPGRHGPSLFNAFLPSVMGSMLEFGDGIKTLFTMYISGDTLFHDHLKEIPKRFPNIDLGLFHLGGTKILGFVLVTMDADQGVKAVKLINPREIIPIHYNDYTVFKSPLEDFIRAMREAGLESKMHVLRHGETYTFEVPAGAKQDDSEFDYGLQSRLREPHSLEETVRE